MHSFYYNIYLVKFKVYIRMDEEIDTLFIEHLCKNSYYSLGE